MTCDLCGGSGVLNVEASMDAVDWVPVASWCHGCPAGAMWRELGLDEVPLP